MDMLAIDVHRCTACRACEVACSFTHEGVFAPHLSRIRVVRFMDQGLNAPVVCVSNSIQKGEAKRTMSRFSEGSGVFYLRAKSLSASATIASIRSAASAGRGGGR